MPDSIETEITVIGAGPGGYPAAFACADHGMKVTLINAEEKPGGVCLHRGCIPSKALLHVAKLIHEAQDSSQWGVTYAAPQIDVAALRGFKNSVVEKLVGGVGQLCQARGVQYVNARATFADSQTLELTDADGNRPYRNPGGALLNYLDTTFGGQKAAAQFVSGGALERHPKLRVLISEGGATWAPFVGDRLNEAYRQHPMFDDGRLPKPPKEYIMEQVYASFQHDETAVPAPKPAKAMNSIAGSSKLAQWMGHEIQLVTVGIVAGHKNSSQSANSGGGCNVLRSMSED